MTRSLVDQTKGVGKTHREMRDVRRQQRTKQRERTTMDTANVSIVHNSDPGMALFISLLVLSQGLIVDTPKPPQGKSNQKQPSLKYANTTAVTKSRVSLKER